MTSVAPRMFVRRIRYVLSGDGRRLYALLALMCGGALLEAVGLAAVLPFLALASDPSRVDDVPLLTPAGNALGLRTNPELLTLSCAVLLAVYVVKTSYLTALFAVQNRFVFKHQERLARRLFEGYLASPYPFHLRRNSAELLRNANFSVLIIFTQIVVPMCYVLIEVMVIVVVLTLLFLVAPLATLAAIGCVGGLAAIAQLVLRRRLRGLSREQQGYQAEIIRWVQQGLGGIKETKVLGREPFFAEMYGRGAHGYAEALRRLRFASDAPRVLIEGITLGGLFAFLLVLLILGRDTDALLPVLGLFAMAAVRLMPSASRILTATTAIRGNMAALDDVYADLVEIDRGTETIEIDPILEIHLRDEIVLDRVSYRYEGAVDQALSDVSLVIGCGESVGFVGSSGAGKTTLVDVVLGLLEPTSGAICVDGTDISRGIRAWQRRVGYIPQPVYVLDDTIRRNVAFALHDDDIDDKQVWRALDAAQLRTFVDALPLSLETTLGERGARLSGGQRQRIGIARALYRDAELLILDEATAALDNETERDVTSAIAALAGEKTIITIAHRLTTVRDCDRLYVLEGGRIVAAGSYDDLLASDERFRQMALAGEGEHRDVG